MKKTIQLLLFALILVLSLAACRLSPEEEFEPTATDVPPFKIVTATPMPTAEATDEVIGRDDTVSDEEDTSSESNGSGYTPHTDWEPTPICYPRSDWPYIYTVVRGDTLSIIARRTATTVSALVTGNCLSNANVISVGQRLYVPNEAIYQPRLTFSTISPTISRSYIQSSNPLFYVAWTVSDRPPNSNLRFDQIMPNGTIVNVELPRNDIFVASEGNGYVRLRNPGNVNQIVLIMSLYNTVNGVTLRYREMIVPILDAPPTWTPTPIPPTPTPIGYPYECYAVSNTPITVYAGFQGTGVPAVGTIPAFTVVEVLTREFNGYYGVRYYWQGTDIAWAAQDLPVYGDCDDLPDIWIYTGHGSGFPPDSDLSCAFVVDATVPLYASPVIAGEVLRTAEVGELFLFNAFGDDWQSGDKTGYWIEIIYDLPSLQKGYIQNTGGHLQGASCPSNKS